MGMCPEEMERWGTASIFKESARLLRKHYRLFLPFFLAFYLPSSIAAVLEIVFLLPSSLPLDIVVQGSVDNPAQTTDPKGDQSFTTIFSWTLLSLTYVVGTLGTGAVSYITAYLYTPTDTDDDRSIVPKVFKFLPHAFLRMFITRLWIVLVDLFLCFLFVLIAVIFNMIIVPADASLAQTLFSVLFAGFLFLAGTIYLTIVFALVQVIAVLEPGNYGRKALKRSTKLARTGRVGTIVAVTLTEIVLSSVLRVPRQGIMTGGIPVWAKIVLGIVIEGLDSVFRVYFGVVLVVMYFVYKARFAAAGGAGISAFKRIDSTEHSYDPIVEGKGSVTYIGEP